MTHISEIEKWFEDHPELIRDNVSLSKFERVVDGRKFVLAHLEALKAHSGEFRWMPHYQRLYKYWILVSKGDPAFLSGPDQISDHTHQK